MQIFGICYIKIFGIFKIEFFFNFQNYKFLETSKLNSFEFSKLQIFEISQIENFLNCPNWKIKKFENFFNSENQSLGPKIGNFGIVRPFDIPHFSQFFQFSNLLFDINQFRRFSFSTFISYSSGNLLD